MTANPLKTGTQDLVGSDQGDVVTGSFGPDKLAGGLGVDQLSGGLGSDVFALTFADPAADILIDFTPAEDKILISGVQSSSKLGRFLKGGSESNKVLATVSSAKTATRSKRLYAYDEQTGNLYFNPNGAKKGYGSGGGLVAELPPLLDLAPTDLQFSYI